MTGDQEEKGLLDGGRTLNHHRGWGSAHEGAGRSPGASLGPHHCFSLGESRWADSCVWRKVVDRQPGTELGPLQGRLHQHWCQCLAGWDITAQGTPTFFMFLKTICSL